MPYMSPKGRIISIMLVPPQEEVDAFLKFLRERKVCHGRDLPPRFQDVLLLEYCKKKGLVTATPRIRRRER